MSEERSNPYPKKTRVIKTDLVVPFKVLELYRACIESHINGFLKNAKHDLRECKLHKKYGKFPNMDDLIQFLVGDML
jgi:hypothetical protein